MIDQAALARLDHATAAAKAREFIASVRRQSDALQDLADNREMTALATLALGIGAQARDLGLPQLAVSAAWLAATAEAGAPVGARLADTRSCLHAGGAALDLWLSRPV